MPKNHSGHAGNILKNKKETLQKVQHKKKPRKNQRYNAKKAENRNYTPTIRFFTSKIHQLHS